MMTSHKTSQDAKKPGDAHVPGDKTLEQTFVHEGDTSSRVGAARPGHSINTANLWIGRQLGKYAIRELLGMGGMGVVYKAHDTLIERDVAIKMLPLELSENELTLQRFLAEAKAAGKLTHTNAVAIYEVGKQEDLYYLVMEYVSGGSLADELHRCGALSVLAATRVAADTCRGLTAAHAVGLVHRDIKPANLLRAQDGSIKVADFGLAKLTLDSSRQMTQAEKIVGTPYFMSPEQCESGQIDHRSDIYSLGATYYAILTGTNPYESVTSIMQVMYSHCNAEVPDPRRINPVIPVACSQIVARAMAKNPADRYQDAAEMLADLNAVLATLSGEIAIALPSQSSTCPMLSPPGMQPLNPIAPPVRRRRVAVALAGVAALVVALGSYAFLRVSAPTGVDEAAQSVVAAGLPATVDLPSGPPIRVGVLHSLTGTMSESESPVVEATLLAIEELNQAGGLLGRKIEPLVRNGRSDSQAFADEAEKLITDDKVCTVFGCWTSASRKTVVPLFEKHNHLLVYPLQYEGLEQSANVIYLGATPNQQIVPAVQWAFAFQGKRRFFLVGSDYVFPRAANAIIRDALASLGAEVVGEEYLPLGSFDVKPIVTKLVAARPDVILNTINGNSNIPFFQELRAQGITPEKAFTISFSIGEEELRHLNVAHIAGDFAAWNYFQSVRSSENEEFVARFKAKYGPQRVINDPMEAAYVGVKLWGQAVNQAKSADVAEIRRAFLDQHILAPEGEVTIDPVTHHAWKTPRIGQVTPEGQFEVVWKAVKPEAPVPFPPPRSRQAWQEFLDKLYVGWGNQWAAPVE